MKDIKLNIEVIGDDMYFVEGDKDLDIEEGYSVSFTITCHGDDYYDEEWKDQYSPPKIAVDNNRYNREIILYYFNGVCDDTDFFYSEYSNLDYEYSLFNE